MQIIPAVDVLGEDSVRLERGDYDKVLFRQPLEEYVKRILDATSPELLHIVDLQGARDGAFRLPVLTRCQTVSGTTPLQVSGGIRSPEQALALLGAGATRVIVGTAAFAHPDALQEFSSALGNALVIAIDVKTGAIKWSHKWEGAGGRSGLLSSAGNLVFAGDTSNNFVAMDAKTGEPLWHANLGSSVSNAPISYELDGKQLLIVGAGDSLFAFTVNEK